MRSIRPDKDIIVKKIKINAGNRKVKALVLAKKGEIASNAPGVLWIHGGGLCAALAMMAGECI